MNILCKYEKKNLCIFRTYMFCVQLYGKWTCWGLYNLYFEALKGLSLKNAP